MTGPEAFITEIPTMPEASITAHLPTVDIELMRRHVPEQNAELITVQIRATPSFEAMERWLSQYPVLPTGNPFQWWTDLMRAAWQPWLAMNPALALLLPRREEGGQ
jgi:hypothetical protein